MSNQRFYEQTDPLDKQIDCNRKTIIVNINLAGSVPV